MSVPRLTFLYPHLFKSVKTPDPSLFRRCPRPPHKKAERTAGFASTSRSKQETYAQRYGPANGPHPPPQLPLSSPPGPGGKEEPKSLSTVIEKEVKTPPSALKQDEQKTQPAKDLEKEAEKPTPEKPSTSSAPSSSANQATALDASESHPKEQSATPTRETSLGVVEAKPMERLLQMESPDEEHKPPHLHAPPYIHHFDTFTLVRDLEKGGFTQAQSVTLMKAVRSLLALNLDVAREGLISKSDIENETYLFRAACSELRTEILALRRNSSITKSTQRSHLQHEVDILSQRAAQESLALKDDLRGLLNDRKMNVRMDQQAQESAIQELNYKITVVLGSEGKSEVEGLRWGITKRAGLIVLAFAVVGTGMVSFWPDSRGVDGVVEGEREGKGDKGGGGGGGGSGGGGGYTVPSREIGTQTEEVMMRSVEQGSGPSYVSLG